MFTYFTAHHLVEERHFEHPADGRFLYLRHNHLLVDLLQYQRNGEDKRRFDLRKSLQQNLRRRSTTYQPCVTAGGDTSEEVERTAVSVRQRKERHEARISMRHAGLHAITHVARQTVQRHDDAFAETRRSAGVVDTPYLGITALIEMHILGPVAIRVLLAEQLRDSLKVKPLRVQSHRDSMPVVQTDSHQHVRYLIQVDAFPVDVADEQQFRARVVDDMNSIVRAEVLQYRYDDGAIGDGGQVHRDPVAVVFAHHGYLIVLLDAALLE